MGKLDEIRNKLRAGSTTRQLIERGYSKSSVYREARNLKDIKPVIPTSPVSDEVQELKHQRDIIKLQKEIAELEAAKEKVPDRMAALEKTVIELRSLLNNAVDTAIFICLKYAGMDREEAREYADGWVGRNIKG